MGFIGLLQLMFIGLKLGHVINWSWWAVMAPTIIEVGLTGFILIVAFIIVCVQTGRQR